MRKVLGTLPVLGLLLLLGAWPVVGGASRDSPQPLTPEMPDESHRLLAEHAALSHGLAGDLAGWIAQGAYDEDHCQFEPYPPCWPWIPSGWHSWDPDTGGYWQVLFWPDDGPGLSRAGDLFAEAMGVHAAGDVEAAYRYLGRAVHLLGDMATPAHVHLDTHLPPLDMDPYEMWLNESDLANTRAWLAGHPPGPEWDLAYDALPPWDELGMDLQGQLEAASQVYGGRASGQELWQLGPEGSDVVIFRLMFLMAEEADNWDSDDVQGEQHHGDLGDPVYLTQMRDTLFPALVPYSAALIDYFESCTRSCPRCQAYLPLASKQETTPVWPYYATSIQEGPDCSRTWVHGYVLDRDGQPEQNVQMRVGNDQGWRADTWTGVDGYYEYQFSDGPIAGQWLLQVFAGGQPGSMELWWTTDTACEGPDDVQEVEILWRHR